MTEFTKSLGEVEEQEGFTVLPEDEYLVKITSAEDGLAKSSGNPVINYQFTFLDEEYKNRKLFKTFSLQGSDEKKTNMVLGMLKKFLMTIGVDRDLVNKFKNAEEVINASMGLEFIADVGIKEYNGKKNNEFKQAKSKEDSYEDI